MQLLALSVLAHLFMQEVIVSINVFKVENNFFSKHTHIIINTHTHTHTMLQFSCITAAEDAVSTPRGHWLCNCALEVCYPQGYVFTV